MAKFKNNIKQAIRDMGVSDTIDLPIERLESVRVMASNLGAIMQRNYTTRRSEDGTSIQVTRIS